jgi:hypothetical protein
LDGSWSTGDSYSLKSFPKVKKKSEEEEIRTWRGEEITEEEIKGNPAVYIDCEIEGIEELEGEEIKINRKVKKGSDRGLGL